ncbi:MAG: endospore germination permease [Limnochordaceae bacterium]|nr:endospore germination permease [Limnochordaceae bacterium]
MAFLRSFPSQVVLREPWVARECSETGATFASRGEALEGAPISTDRSGLNPAGALSPGSLTPFQVVAVLVNAMVGVEVLSLPRVLARDAGTGAWLAVLVAAAAVVLVTAGITGLGDRMPGLPHTAYLPVLMGPVGGRVALVALALYRLAAVALVARLFGEFVITAVLLKTPIEVTIVVMLALVTYQSRQSIAAFARLQELTFLPLVLLAIVVLAPALQNVRAELLFPLLGEDWRRSVTAAPDVVGSYLGFDTLLFLYGLATPAAYAAGKHRRQARAAALSAVAIATGIYVVVVEAALAVFGPFELAELQWPVLEIVKTIRLPGIIIERMDAPFVGLWVLAVFTTLSAFHFTATHELGAVLHLRAPSSLALPFSIVAFALAMLPPSTLAAEQAGRLVSFGGMGLIVVVTALGLLASWVRGAPGRRSRSPAEDPGPR